MNLSVVQCLTSRGVTCAGAESGSCHLNLDLAEDSCTAPGASVTLRYQDFSI